MIMCVAVCVAMRCSAVQSVLQCVAVCVAAYFSVLQCISVCCSVIRCVAAEDKRSVHVHCLTPWLNIVMFLDAPICIYMYTSLPTCMYVYTQSYLAAQRRHIARCTHT